MIHPSFVVLVLVAAALLFDVSAANAQYLSERLTPPLQVPLSAIPLIGQPTESQPFGAEKIPAHLWSLPVGAFPGANVVLSSESQPVQWRRPVLDVPGLASEFDPNRPAFPLQPIAPRVFALGANPEQPPILARFPLAAETPILPLDNPTDSEAFALLTVGVSLATPTPVPLMLLAIPDPFEQIHKIRLRTVPADVDDPSTAQDRPPLAKLPMVEPPK